MFDGGKFEFYVATILTWLGGEDDVAAEHAREVVAQCTAGGAARWPMRLAMSQIDLAFIAARRGDLDEAAALGSEALTHSRRSAQLLPRAFELGDDLATRYPGEQLVVEYARELPTAQPPAVRSTGASTTRRRAATVHRGWPGRSLSGTPCRLLARRVDVTVRGGADMTYPPNPPWQDDPQYEPDPRFEPHLPHEQRPRQMPAKGPGIPHNRLGRPGSSKGPRSGLIIRPRRHQAPQVRNSPGVVILPISPSRRTGTSRHPSRPTAISRPHLHRSGLHRAGPGASATVA